MLEKKERNKTDNKEVVKKNFLIELLSLREK